MRVRIAQVLVLATCLVGFVAPAPKVTAACQRDHVVRRGESWWSIAESKGVSLREILRLNGARPSTVLQPGDAVCVPGKPARALTTYSDKEVIQIIREIWPDHLEDKAIVIARRESKLRPEVVGIPNECCYGLFQIYYKWHKSWLPRIGITGPRQLLDPRKNAIAALEIYRRNGGWGPWE